MAFDRLVPEDLELIDGESTARPQHAASLFVVAGAPLFGDDGRCRIGDLRAGIEARLHLVPRFRQRLLEVPFEQGRPVWADDPSFDIAEHVRLTALPRPGEVTQLHTLVGRILGQLLPRDRPLWELWFVEGLAGGRVAVLIKTHHALVDGVGAMDVASVLLDRRPDQTPEAAPAWTPETPPSAAQLVTGALLERMTRPSEAAWALRAALRGPAAVLDRVTTLAGAAVPRAAPRPWQVPLRPGRRYRTARIPLDLVRSVKDAAGCTVHDVVLAACAGALRDFLIERGVPVHDLALRALVPISAIRPSASSMPAIGQRISGVAADLPVDEADPRQRVRRIHEHLASVTRSGIALGGDLLADMDNYLPSTVLAVAHRALRDASRIDLGIINVPGPQFPLWFQGARVEEAYPCVGLIDDHGLGIGIVSYDGWLHVGLTADRSAVPDLTQLATGIGAAVDELATAFGVVA